MGTILQIGSVVLYFTSSRDKLLKLQRIIFENYGLIEYKWNEICKDTPTKQYRRDRHGSSKNKGKRG